MMGVNMELNNFANYLDRARPIGVLYVDVYPYSFNSAGEVEYLLLKRRNDVVMPSQWQPVCGKINAGERIIEAFTRQVKKKTNHIPRELKKVDYINVFFDEYYDTVMMVPTATCEIGRDVIVDSSLHTEFTFISYDQLSQYSLFDAQMRVYHLLHGTLRKSPAGKIDI